MTAPSRRLAENILVNLNLQKIFLDYLNSSITLTIFYLMHHTKEKKKNLILKKKMFRESRKYMLFSVLMKNCLFS